MRILCLLLLLCLTMGIAARAETPRPVLCSVYEQRGWGDRVKISFVDEEGGLWMGEGYASKMGWSGSLEDKALRVPGLDGLEHVGELSRDDVFAIKSLINAAEDRGRKLQPGPTLDYGIYYIYAVRYSREGEPECVLLNAYGDSMFANTDANALGLRFWLAKAFASGSRLETDQILEALGIVPVPMSDYCGFDTSAIRGTAVSATLIDCEEGPIPVKLSESEETYLRGLAERGRVTAKANAIETSGGMYAIDFSDGEGNVVASFELYEGLLVRGDGMYYIDTTD